MDSVPKHRRTQRSPSPQYHLDGDEPYEPYIPVAQRRQEKLAKFSSLSVNAGRNKAKRLQEDQYEDREDVLKEEERMREKARKERTLLIEAQEVQKRKAVEGVLFSTSPFFETYGFT